MVDPVLVSVPLVDCQVVFGERERHDFSPFRTEEVGGAFHQVARLVDEPRERKRLPPVQVFDVGIAGLLGLQRRVHRLVCPIGVIGRFVGAVGQAEPDISVGDMVPQRFRGAILVRRRLAACVEL